MSDSAVILVGRCAHGGAEGQKPAAVPATRQWPEVGRTAMCHRKGCAPLPAKVVAVVPDPGPHPKVVLVVFGISITQPATVLPAMPLFDPLGGRTPPGDPEVWAEWMPFQADQHAKRAAG